MNSLDERIMEVLRKPGYGLASWEDQALDQIKELFLGGGEWYKLPSKEQTGIMTTDNRLFMSGQKWYERFKKELTGVQEVDTIVGFDREHPRTSYYYSTIIKSAQRASNVGGDRDGD